MQLTLTRRSSPVLQAASVAILLAAIAGCSSTPLTRAPVVDRPVNNAKPAPPKPAASVPVIAETPAPGSENAGKPGYYTVKPGDQLIHIALDSGVNWRDVARWNNIDNPDHIEVGQVLRVQSPGNDGPASTKPVTSARLESRPLETKPGSASASAAASGAGGTLSSAATPAVAASTASTADEDVAWIWPAKGSVLAGFDEVSNKGLDIGGKAGDPVLAAADGRVMYVGSGLRGYGNLVIIKHNGTYLTAYAHNQTLLVKDDEVVRKGQRIAEMGSSDADQVELHFEIRKLGKPIDPAKLLPSR